MVWIQPNYELREKIYDIEYKLGPFNVFSKETGTSEHCESYYSSRVIKNKPSGAIVLDHSGYFDNYVHDCKDIKYYLTFKPTLFNTPIDFNYTHIEKSNLEQKLKLKREFGDSGMDFSDYIEDIGYVIKTKEVPCSHTHETLDDYKSEVQMLNIALLTIILASIFSVRLIQKRRSKMVK